MNQILQLLRRNLYILVFLLLEAIALVLFFNNNQQPSSSLYEFGTAIKGRFLSIGGDVRSKDELKAENLELQKENAWLRAQLETSKLPLLHQEKAFRTDSAYAQRYICLCTRIVHSTLNLSNNYFILDAGRAEGVEAGMGVISPRGIIGIVDKVSEHFSSVLTVLHSQSLVSVSLASSGFSGSLSWPGIRYDEAVLSDIPSHVRIRIGEKVVTSGLSSVFPGGIPVGYVEEVISEPGEDFYRLRIRFSEDYHGVDHVYIVKDLYKAELESCRQHPFGEI